MQITLFNLNDCKCKQRDMIFFFSLQQWKLAKEISVSLYNQQITEPQLWE